MSGFPNQLQVSALRGDVLRMAELEKSIKELKTDLTIIKKNLEECEIEYHKLHDNVWDLMVKMDVNTSQNFGWQSRMFAFLKELIVPEEES